MSETKLISGRVPTYTYDEGHQIGHTVHDRGFWVCPDCGFAFSEMHANQNGTYSCPCCELIAADKEIEQAHAAGVAEERARARAILEGHVIHHGDDCDDCLYVAISEIESPEDFRTASASDAREEE